MKSASTFDGWEFLEQWTIDDQNDYPRLIWQNMQGNPITDTKRCYSGGTGEPNKPYCIATAEDLQTTSKYIGDWNKYFILVQDINLNNVKNNTPTPIGLPTVPFTGVFDGNDHTIKGLTYYIPNEEYVSLFRYVGQDNADANSLNGVIYNLHLNDVNIVGTDFVSSLVGLNKGLIQSCSVSGYIRTEETAGGLVAENLGIISGCSGNIDVLRYKKGSKGRGDTGGLVGLNKGYVYNCAVSGNVDGTYGSHDTGGLVGSSYGGEIINSYSSADVNSYRFAGGLIGSASGTEIICCYTIGNVNSLESGDVDTGGLVGSMYGILVSSYSRGSVSGSGYVGSLVGQNGGTITSCYATGEVSGSGVLGGLVADDFLGTIYLSYWDSDSTRQNISAGGTGLTTDEMQTESTFADAGWDFVDETANGTEDIWWILEGQDYPRLWWENGGN